MQIRLFLFFLWLLLPLSPIQAQKVLVCDGATRFPIRDVLVSVDGKNVGLGGFDLGLILDKRYRRDRRHVRELREIFKKMDGLEDKEDPILKAYRQTQQELKADSIQKKNEKKELKK